MSGQEICHLKATDACVKRGFVVPRDDAWIFAASTTLLATVCGDCRAWYKERRQKEVVAPAISR